MIHPQLLIEHCYRSILGRDPDREEVKVALDALHIWAEPSQLMRMLIASDEFKDRLAEFILRDGFSTERSRRDTDAFYKIVEDGIRPTEFAALYGAEPGNEYLRYHFIRFRELFSFIGAAVAKKGPAIKVFEVGVSYYTTHFYRKLFPELNLYTLDRPTETGGCDIESAKRAGAIKHYNVDLNSVEFFDFLELSSLAAKFDLVVCCEVIEHLQRCPEDIFRGLLALLSRDGELFITTPNYFSLHNLRQTLQGLNPSPTFAGFLNNKDAHHHYREYTLRELTQLIKSAGGHIVMSAYSNAWEPNSHMTPLEYAYRSNLVIVAKRQQGSALD